MDSVRELAVTTFNALSGERISTLDELPKNYLELFRVNRSFGHDPYEMVLIARWVMAQLNNGQAVINPNEQAQLREKYPEKKQITDDFFKCRADLVAKEPDRWLALNQPFQPIWSAVQNAGFDEIVIVTTKNRVAVLDLCSFYRLPVEAKNVYAGDELKTKTQHFLTLAQRFAGDSMEFLEDSVQNLLTLRKELPKELCPKLLVARWGYLSASQLSSAEENGLTTFSQEEFLRWANIMG